MGTVWHLVHKVEGRIGLGRGRDVYLFWFYFILIFFLSIISRPSNCVLEYDGLRGCKHGQSIATSDSYCGIESNGVVMTCLRTGRILSAVLYAKRNLIEARLPIFSVHALITITKYVRLSALSSFCALSHLYVHRLICPSVPRCHTSQMYHISSLCTSRG